MAHFGGGLGSAAGRPAYASRSYGAAGVDLGAVALILLLMGFYTIYLNLEVYVARNTNNPIEKSLLALAIILFFLARPLSQVRFFLLLFIAVIPAISLVASDFLYTNMNRFIRGYFAYLSPFMMMVFIPREADARKFLMTISFIPLFCVSLGYALQIVGINDNIFYLGFEGEMRLKGSSIPAFLAAGSALACFTAMCCARHFDQRFFLLVGVNLVILALTGGRMALVIGLLACAFVVLTRYRITFKLISLGVIAAIGMVALAFVAFPDLIQRLTSDTDSGRAMIWDAMFRVWNNHPYFGIGLGHQTMIMPESVERWVKTLAAHNEYIRLGLEIGWVGLILFCGAFLAFVAAVTFSAPKAGDPLFFLMAAAFAVFCYSDNALSLPCIFGLMTAAYFERFVGVGKPARIPLKPFRKTPPQGWGRPA